MFKTYMDFHFSTNCDKLNTQSVQSKNSLLEQN